MNLLLTLLLSVSVFAAKAPKKAPAPKPFPSSKSRMTKVATCAQKDDATKKVYIVKQWHLSPKTTTRGFKEKYPHEKNQTAIYQMLEDGVKRKELDMVVSEGCEGEINEEFKSTFNGWDFASLKAQSSQRGYDKVLTLIPLKVEAKYGDKIATMCGDSDDLIREGSLRLSNLRGWMGFYLRLNEKHEDPEKLKLYSESAAELLKVSKDTPPEKLMPMVKEKLKAELEAFDKSLTDRNDSFLKTLEGQEFKNAAVVIGGLHAQDLKEKVEKAGMNCVVLEPPGYQRESESLIQEFRKALE